MMRGVRLCAILAIGAVVAQPASAVPLEGTFLDTLQINAMTVNIGDRPDNAIVQPAVMVTLPGPLSGLVTGQFEATFPGGNTPAVVSANWQMRWGLVQVDANDPSTGTFVQNANGDEIFVSNLGPNSDGFTAVNLPGSPLAPIISWTEFQFDLASEGIELVPGNTYALFALLDEDSDPVPFPPGNGPVPTTTGGGPLQASQIIDIATGLTGPTGDFQQLFESQINAGGVAGMDKIATSVLLDVVPEPGSSVLLLCGAVALVRRRR